MEEAVMGENERDILGLLKAELAFIEQGGYRRSVRAPWMTTSTFQDSLTCINYGYPYRAHPCSECPLLDFVSPDSRSTSIPCHHIPLNGDGKTIEDLEGEDNQPKMEAILTSWLRMKISEIERQGASLTTGL